MKRLGLLLCLSLLFTPGWAKTRALPWLHAEGTQIVDDTGKAVLLRGVNLGGWLVEEMWMMPFVTDSPEGSDLPRIRDHVSLWQAVEKRFGVKGKGRIRTALRENWINESDFDRIRNAGFNCIRLPFLYDLLDEPGGFHWLDDALRWAAKRNIYVILDLHGAPGRQSKDHHTGEEGVNRLFFDPHFVEETERVWKRVAQRYRNHPEVAGYDLLNEPMGAPSAEALNSVMDRLYRAVRSVDTRHIVIVEDGYKGLDKIASPAERNWENVMLSVHFYHFDAKSAQAHLDALDRDIQRLKPIQEEKKAPLYVGEFNLEPRGTPDTMAKTLAEMQGQDWSWSVWMYKMVQKGGDRSMWGLYRNPRPVEALDPYRDSEADLIRKLSQVRTEHLEPFAALLEAYRTAGGMPFANP